MNPASVVAAALLMVPEGTTIQTQHKNSSKNFDRLQFSTVSVNSWTPIHRHIPGPLTSATVPEDTDPALGPDP